MGIVNASFSSLSELLTRPYTPKFRSDEMNLKRPFAFSPSDEISGSRMTRTKKYVGCKIFIS